jgi:hypothetical protein
MARCCDEVAVHNHGNQTYRNGRPYEYRFAFRWSRPRVRAYKAAERRRFSVGLNRYPGVVIGVGLQIGRRVLSVTWGSPGRIIEIEGVSV